MFTLFHSSKCLNIYLSLNIYSGLCFFKWNLAHMQIILFSKCASVWTAASFRSALCSSRSFKVSFSQLGSRTPCPAENHSLALPALLTIFTVHLTHLVVSKRCSEITLRSCKIIKHISYLKLKKIETYFYEIT